MFNTSDNQGYALVFTGMQDSTPCGRSNSSTGCSPNYGPVWAKFIGPAPPWSSAHGCIHMHVTKSFIFSLTFPPASSGLVSLSCQCNVDKLEAEVRSSGTLLFNFSAFCCLSYSSKKIPLQQIRNIVSVILESLSQFSDCKQGPDANVHVSF